MPIKYPTTSKTLLEKISSGDEISWDEFYRKYAPVIKAVAKYKGIEYDADDICQQVMMHFFKQSKTFKFDPGLAKFRTYLGQIVSWKIADYYRKKREKKEKPARLTAKKAPKGVAISLCPAVKGKNFRKLWRSRARKAVKEGIHPFPKRGQKQTRQQNPR